jgi:glutamate synthase domain-containing protein 1
MCGIVGLHLRDESLYPALGELLTPMLVSMGLRGPDSAGIALYDDDLDAGMLRWSLRATEGGSDWEAVAEKLGTVLNCGVAMRRAADDAVLTLDVDPELVLKALADWFPEVGIVSHGHAVEVYKDVGDPAEICKRYGIARRSGYQGLGHTRMATESAVTTEHSHPFAAGSDLCLVHNGSFSNYATVRRRLTDAGITFDTDNDSEVAARYLAHEIGNGAHLGEALAGLMDTLDGFFTLLVATETQFAVVRDAFACKPAVVAETDGYVAMASEYQALATLPGIEDANVFEPMPREIHVWTR